MIHLCFLKNPQLCYRRSQAGLGKLLRSCGASDHHWLWTKSVREWWEGISDWQSRQKSIIHNCIKWTPISALMES